MFAGNLTTTPVLLLDLQATTGRPDTGILWEAGWAWYCGGDPPASVRVSVRTLTLPPGRTLPAAVVKVAGLTTADPGPGISEEELWRELEQAASEPPVPVVIHFARYESSYLQHLHALYAGARPFPFRTICTHRLAQRLMPELPRFGLRAVAGFLGYSVPEPRRAFHHVPATAVIWHHIVRRLVELGVEEPQALMEWLAEEPIGVRRAPRIPLRRPGSRLPPCPGVYGMFRCNGDLLYVGKARRLDRRLPSYFRRRGHAEHTLEMLTQARTLRTRVTFSALEAALLECHLIQSFDPPYNKVLRCTAAEPSYFSRDLQERADGWDAQHPVGPLTDPGPPQVLAALVRTLGETLAGEAGPQAGDALASSASLLPYLGGTEFSPELWQEVLKQIRELAGIDSTADRRAVAVRLLRWGRRDRGPNRRHEEPAESPRDVGPAEAPAGATNPELEGAVMDQCVGEGEPPPAERLVRGLAGLCAYISRMESRGRWCRRLQRAAVRWRLGPGRWNLVVTVQGIPVFAGYQEDGEVLPVLSREPAGGMEPLDHNGCVRLRILATELRRLQAEGAEIEVALPEGRFLSARRLEVWLRWL